MDTFLRAYLPFYLLLYLGVAFVWPTYRTRKQTGINPVTFSSRDTGHDYIGFIMKQLIGLLLVAVIFYTADRGWYQYLLPVWYMENEGIRIAGLLLIHVSLIWVIIAQQQMSNSWRIGIDENNKTELVTHGVFGISRNPIFLGMIATVLGLFLVLPNALTFFLALSVYIVIQVQIRLEEDFLEQQHGEGYIAYKEKVRRLI